MAATGSTSIVQGPVACTSNPVVRPPPSPALDSVVRIDRVEHVGFAAQCAYAEEARRIVARDVRDRRAGILLPERDDAVAMSAQGDGAKPYGRSGWRLHWAWTRGGPVAHRWLPSPSGEDGAGRGGGTAVSLTVEGVGAEAVGAEAVVAGADVARRRVRRRRMRPSKPASSSTMARADIGPVNESATVALPTEDASAAAGRQPYRRRRHAGIANAAPPRRPAGRRERHQELVVQGGRQLFERVTTWSVEVSSRHHRLGRPPASRIDGLSLHYRSDRAGPDEVIAEPLHRGVAAVHAGGEDDDLAGTGTRGSKLSSRKQCTRRRRTDHRRYAVR